MREQHFDAESIQEKQGHVNDRYERCVQDGQYCIRMYCINKATLNMGEMSQVSRMSIIIISMFPAPTVATITCNH